VLLNHAPGQSIDHRHLPFRRDLVRKGHMLVGGAAVGVDHENAVVVASAVGEIVEKSVLWAKSALEAVPTSWLVNELAFKTIGGYKFPGRLTEAQKCPEYAPVELGDVAVGLSGPCSRCSSLCRGRCTV